MMANAMEDAINNSSLVASYSYFLIIILKSGSQTNYWTSPVSLLDRVTNEEGKIPPPMLKRE